MAHIRQRGQYLRSTLQDNPNHEYVYLEAYDVSLALQRTS